MDPEVLSRLARELLELPSAAPAAGGLQHPTLRVDPPPRMANPRSAAARAPAARGSTRYRLLCELGRGGMGIVYRAHDTVLGRDVALKVLLLGGFADGALIDRFQREARASAALDHDHIVKVLDVGVLDADAGGEAHPFYTMELLEGRNLAERIQSGALPPREAVEIVRQMAGALHYAHEKGILHRDVKPENVFLRHAPPRRTAAPTAADAARTETVMAAPAAVDGVGRQAPSAVHALLVDFGLAKVLDHAYGSGIDAAPNRAANLTRSGQILGTPVYMAPEQARGKRDVDARADVYSLGATLYHALTGQAPFAAPTLAEVLEQVQEQDPAPPRRLRPELDPDLETLVLKCLAKEPQTRYAAAADLEEDCRRWLAGEPLLARPVGAAGRLWRRMRRSPRIAALAVACVSLALAVMGLVTAYAVWPNVRAALDRRRHAEAVAARARDAGILLERARGSLQVGRPTEAEGAARALLAAFADAHAQGEDLPIGDAHLVLAEVERGRNRPRAALAEAYHAFEAEAGGARTAERLVSIGEQLAAMGEMARAAGVFGRALEAPRDAQADFAARLGLARAYFGLSRYDEARTLIDSLAGRAEAGVERQRMLDGLGALAELFHSRRDLDADVQDFAAADLDGDGLAEIVGLSADAREVVVHSLRPRVEPVRLRLLNGEPYVLERVAALDLDGDGRPEIVAAGAVFTATGNRDRTGRMFVLRWVDHALAVSASVELGATLFRGCFAAADIDGDGRIEFIVGTGWYDRALRFYHYDGTRGALEFLGSRPMGGDVLGVIAFDADGNGLPELWSVVGPWSTFGLLCLEYDRATHRLEARGLTPLARNASLSFFRPGSGGNEILAAIAWEADALGPLHRNLGKEEVERSFRQNGLYRIRLRSDLRTDVEPMWEIGWATEPAPVGWVGAIRRRGQSFAWGAMARVSSTEDVLAAAAGRIYRREGAEWRFLTDANVPGALGSPPLTQDLDGDGDDELVVPILDPSHGGIRTLQIFGLRGAAAAAASPARGAGDATRPVPVPPRSAPAALLAAREADWLGLNPESEAAYGRALAAAVSFEDLQEAAVGLIHARARQDRWDDAARDVRTWSARWPSLRASAQRALLEDSTAAFRWDLALETARDLQSSPDLKPEESSALARRILALSRQVRPRTVVSLAEEGLVGADLLATSPLFVRREADETLLVQGSSEARDYLLVPLSFDDVPYRVDARVETLRQDWECDLAVGVIAGEPWALPPVKNPRGVAGLDFPRQPQLHAARLSSTGETHDPLRRWALDSVGLAGLTERFLPAEPDPPCPARTIAIEYADPCRRLRLRVEPSPSGAASETVELPVTPIQEPRAFLMVTMNGTAGNAERWASFRLSQVRLESGHPNVAPARYSPRRAVDFVFLANGLWIRGRVSEARADYDAVAALADQEEREDRERGERHLPRENELPWTAPYVRWAAVDARVWRGLLRAEQGDETGALEDLHAAADRSLERVQRLLRNVALPLRSRPASAVVRRFLIARAAADHADDPLAIAGLYDRNWGAVLTDLALETTGFELVEVLLVTGTTPAASDAPVRAGDLLLGYDGAAVHDAGDLRRAAAAARGRGQRSVTVDLMRGGKPLSVPIDPTRGSILTQPVLRLGERKR